MYLNFTRTPVAGLPESKEGQMPERHTLYERKQPHTEPVKLRVFTAYKTALKAGMRECEHGTWWIDSEHKADGAGKWTEFCPVVPRLKDLELDELKEMIE